MIRHLTLAGVCLALCTLVVFADTLKLKDGTTIEGKVIPQGDKYWIKTADGQTRIVPKDQVLSYEKSAPGAPVTPSPATPNASGTTDSTMKATPPGGAVSFALTKSKADKVESPVLAVSIWEKYI